MVLLMAACCLSGPIANDDSDVVIDKCDRLPLCFDFVLFLSLLLLLGEWGVAAAADDSSAEIMGVAAAAAALLAIRSNEDGVAEERW